MSSIVLEKIFGGAARVKLMQLFLFHADKVFDKEDARKKTKISEPAVRKELPHLVNIGLIKKVTFYKTVQLKTGHKKKREAGYILNKKFPFLNHLKNILINTIPLQENSLVKKLNKVCNPKFILVSGIFLQADDSRIDLLVVSDNLKESAMRSVINDLEAEIGKEIRYAVFNKEDFDYRVNLHDHLVRDIFDFPHQILVNKLGL
ncbi:MAG TPA: hypothetical protein P5328_01305 [Candidatus Paceibacterota bacterium]|nr:hypothetical protein [Candidatus Paceibacterota bacterium]HRZ34723.1 hypothetical protein [Candidatus Paceibacterota bacterium]